VQLLDLIGAPRLAVSFEAFGHFRILAAWAAPDHHLPAPATRWRADEALLTNASRTLS
jgi:hypothetical protein